MGQPIKYFFPFGEILKHIKVGSIQALLFGVLITGMERFITTTLIYGYSEDEICAKTLSI